MPANAHGSVQQNCRVREGGRGRGRVGVTSAGELGEFEVPRRGNLNSNVGRGQDLANIVSVKEIGCYHDASKQQKNN